MLRIKMLKPNVPIAQGEEIITPKVGDEIEVSNSVGTSLIRGGDGEQVEVKAKAQKKAPKNKSFSEAPENK